MVRSRRRLSRSRRRLRPRRYRLRRRRVLRRRSRRTPRQTGIVTRTFTLLNNNVLSVIWSSAQGTAGVHAVQLSQHADALAFAAGFDQFRINWCRYSMIPTADRNTLYQVEGAGTGTSCATAGLPMWGAFVDLDDIDTPASGINNIIQHRGKYATWPRSVSLKWQPRPLAMVYKSSTTTGYSLISKNAWLDVNDNTVPHYGIKWYFAHPHSTSSADTSPMLLPYLSKITISVSFKHFLPGATVGNI